MELTDHFIEYLDGTKLRPALVQRHSAGGKLHVVDPKGRRQTVAPQHVAVVHSLCRPVDRFPAIQNQLMRDIAELAGQVDIDLLWSSVVDEEDEERDAAALAAVYFGKFSAAEQSALLRALIQNPQYFKRRGLAFKPRTREQVEEQRRLAQLQAERKAWDKAAISWMREVLAADREAELPDQLSKLPAMLERFLWEPKDEHVERLVTQSAGATPLREAVVDILMRSGRLPADTDPWLATAGIREHHSSALIKAAEELPRFVDSDGREDLTGLFMVTIDDDETTEVDDALSIHHDGDRRTIGIHIADVAHFVEPGTSLDDEARKRSTTVYLPTRTTPMLPPPLGADKASLNADGPRPAVSFLVTVDADVNVLEQRIVRTVIHVDRRLNYEEADNYLGQADGSLTHMLGEMRNVATTLRLRRVQQGALVLKRPELKLRVHDDQVEQSVIEPTSASRQTVSEFMVLANRVAADYAVAAELPMIYRTQKLGAEIPSRTELDYNPVLFAKILKNMRRTELSLHPRAHDSLGVAAYVQATSPLRRYVDLIAQRQLIHHLEHGQPRYSGVELMPILAESEATEAEIRSLEGRAKRYWQLAYVDQQCRDRVLRGIVVSRLKTNSLVELEDMPIRGLLRGTTIAPGQLVAISVEHVNASRNELRFRII